MLPCIFKAQFLRESCSTLKTPWRSLIICEKSMFAFQNLSLLSFKRIFWIHGIDQIGVQAWGTTTAQLTNQNNSEVSWEARNSRSGWAWKRHWLPFTTFVFMALFRLFIVLHEVSSNAGRATFPTALFFCISSLLPPCLKAGLSRALRCLCSAAQERDESSTELSSNTLLWVRVARPWVGGVRSVVSHLLVLRCRVEIGPGRSASGCWDCWPALPPSLNGKRAETDSRGLGRKINMGKDRWQAYVCVVFILIFIEDLLQ